MQEQDQVIVLGLAPFAEQAQVLSFMGTDTGYGRVLLKRLPKGLGLQPGQVVQLQWRRRLPHQLGAGQVLEVINHFAQALQPGLSALLPQYAYELCRSFLAEGDAHPQVYGALQQLLQAPVHFATLAQFECQFLSDIGFGLTLSGPQVQRQPEEALYYVSPKTGVAASQRVGVPYAERLLRLPACLGGTGGGAAEAYQVLSHFFHKAQAEFGYPSGLPARETLWQAL